MARKLPKNDRTVQVTERGTVGDSSGARWKGIIFGQKANSRNGFFHPSAVKQVGKPAQVYTLMPAPRNGVSQTLSRQAKRVELPVVPHMEMISNKHENDYNHNSRPSPIRSKSSTSSTSEETNSRYGAINGNKRVSPMSTFSGGSFNSYGTDTAQLLGAKYLGMASLSPTTSGTLLADSPRISTGSISSQSSSGFESSKSNGMASASSSSSSFLCSSSFNAANQDPTQCRSSVHSLGSGGSGDSSLASSSMDALDDSFYSISSSTELSSRVTQMVAKRVPEAEILAIWLDKIGMTEYLSMFLTQGYDLASIARITPEDLITLGITNPQHRRKLIADIHSWQITDSWPSVFPIGGVSEWLTALAMPEYTSVFEEQGYDSLQEVIKLGWEDFEDIGIKRLGHLKRLMLAAKKLKDHERLQGQQSTGRLSSAVPVASPMLSARVIEHNNSSNRHGDPPPPAPLESSWMTPPLTGGIDYVSYTRGGMKMHNKAAPNPPMRSQSNISSMCSSNNSKRRAKSSYDSLFDQIEPIRLNLVSTGKILSEAVPEKELPPLTSGSSFYSIDYPPPPAPLNCEGSIRRLQKAFHSSTSSSESTSSLEQLPFANDNCGTIRSRDTLSNATSRLPLSSMSRSNQSSTVKMDRYAESKTPTANSNVLSDIGSMLQNLTDELDAMLTTKLSANVDPSSEHCIR